MEIAYYNGKIYGYSEVKIPLTDRAIFFGDGIYDAALGRRGKIHLEAEHISRFFKNARRLKIPFGFNEEQLCRLMHELIEKAGEECFFIYLQLSRYGEKRLHASPDREKSNLLITVTRQELPRYDERLKLITREDLRYYFCDVKTINLLPSVLAATEAASEGADEVVFHRGKTVTECAHSNISIIKNGELITHPKSRLILPGIMRERLICECRRMGIPVREEPFTTDDLFSADCALVTSSTKLARRVESIDGIRIGSENDEIPKEICKKIYDDFIKLTK